MSFYLLVDLAILTYPFGYRRLLFRSFVFKQRFVIVTLQRKTFLWVDPNFRHGGNYFRKAVAFGSANILCYCYH